MTNLIAIDNKNHNGLAINSSRIEQHGANLNLVPVVTFEFTNAASQYPIVISKHEETGQFTIGALTGFEQGENLFWQNNEWQGLYLPLQIQRQPFFIGNSDDTNEEQYLVCFDKTSPAITDVSESDENCHPLFNEDGTESEYFEHAKQCLAQLLHGEESNKRLLNMLAELELIQPMSLEITFANEQSKRLNGLYTIDKDRLSTLSQEQVFQLHQNGMLEPIYTMITSLGQIYGLIDRKNKAIQS